MSLRATLRRWLGGGARPRGVRRGRSLERRSSQETVRLDAPDPPRPAAGVPPAPAAAAPGHVAAHLPPPPPAPRPAPSPAGGEATRYGAPAIGARRVVGVLVAVEGELEGEVYSLPDGECRLGRASECEVRLPSDRISRQHARVVHRDGLFVIAPLSDRNTTLVNDQPTEGTELCDGDYVRLGETTFRFRTVA